MKFTFVMNLKAAKVIVSLIAFLKIKPNIWTELKELMKVEITSNKK